MISMKKTAALVVIATAALTASVSFAYEGGSAEGLGGGFDADSLNHKHGHHQQHQHHHGKALKKALHTAFKACKAAKVDHKACAKELTAYISAFKPTAAEATASTTSTPAN